MFYKIAFCFIPIIFIYNKKFRNISFWFNDNSYKNKNVVKDSEYIDHKKNEVNDNSYKNRNLKYSEHHNEYKKNGINFIVKIIDHGYLDLLLLDYSDDHYMLKYIFKCFDDYYFDYCLGLQRNERIKKCE
jgi:uncharacterized membrane protein YhiD involved in acid resistance